MKECKKLVFKVDVASCGESVLCLLVCSYTLLHAMQLQCALRWLLLWGCRLQCASVWVCEGVLHGCVRLLLVQLAITLLSNQQQEQSRAINHHEGLIKQQCCTIRAFLHYCCIHSALIFYSSSYSLTVLLTHSRNNEYIRLLQPQRMDGIPNYQKLTCNW